MATYYEVLALPPTAADAEIEAALDDLYTKWRRLVTHHDASVADQANQALRQLETIRATLLDDAKRAGYDAGIGLTGQIGGLADPEAALRAIPTTMSAAPAISTPPRRRATPVAASKAAPGLWACPTNGCGADNPPNTKFCLKCGTQLVRECPECSKMSSLVASGFCGECGFQYNVAEQRLRLRTRMEQLLASLKQQQAAVGVLNEKRRIWTTEWNAIGCFGVIAFLSTAIGILAFIADPNAGLVLFGVAAASLLIAASIRGGLSGRVASAEQDIRSKEQELAELYHNYEQLGSQRSG